MLLAAPSNIKLGQRGQTLQEVIGGSYSIVKLVPHSTSFLVFFVDYSGEWLQLRMVHILVGENNPYTCTTLSHILYLTYDLTFQVTVLMICG